MGNATPVGGVGQMGGGMQPMGGGMGQMGGGMQPMGGGMGQMGGGMQPMGGGMGQMGGGMQPMGGGMGHMGGGGMPQMGGMQSMGGGMMGGMPQMGGVQQSGGSNHAQGGMLPMGYGQGPASGQALRALALGSTTWRVKCSLLSTPLTTRLALAPSRSRPALRILPARFCAGTGSLI